MKKNVLEYLDFYTVSVLILCIVGFVLRFTNVDFLTIWMDEYMHVLRADDFPSQPLITTDNNGILYTILVLPFFKLFSANELWARFPSVILGTLSIPLLYLFGKKYFNRYVGLFAAVLLTFSQYHVFWSRIARNYAIFLFMFLLLAYYLGVCLNVKDEFKPLKNKLFSYLRCTPQSLCVVALLVFLAILSHHLSFMVIYAIGVYHFVMFIVRLFQKKYRFLSLNAIVSYFFVFYCIVLFTPAFKQFILSVLDIPLIQGVMSKVVPEFDRIAQLFREHPFDVLKVYVDVLKTDYSSLYVLGFLGLILGIVRFRKSGLFNFSLFVPAFTMMCFIFREPSLPRYIIFLYPFFLLAIALVFYEALSWIYRIVKGQYARGATLCIALIALVLLSPVRKSWAMVNSKKHGRVIANELSHWYFPDWKSALQNVKQQLKPDDVILSTVPFHPRFYLRRQEVFWFRQRRYNDDTHQYDNLPVDTTVHNVSSLLALERLYSASESGWLFGDYYFSNVLTDPAARDFVIRNTDFIYSMSNSDVKVFHWDKSQQKRYGNTMAELLTQSSPATFEYSMTLPNLSNRKVEVMVEAEGVRYDNELLLLINGKTIGVPLKSSNNQGEGRQNFVVELPANTVKEGENKIRFSYNTNEYRYNKNAKVAVYNLGMQWR